MTTLLNQDPVDAGVKTTDYTIPRERWARISPLPNWHDFGLETRTVNTGWDKVYTFSELFLRIDSNPLWCTNFTQSFNVPFDATNTHNRVWISLPVKMHGHISIDYDPKSLPSWDRCLFDKTPPSKPLTGGGLPTLTDFRYWSIDYADGNSSSPYQNVQYTRNVLGYVLTGRRSDGFGALGGTFNFKSLESQYPVILKPETEIQIPHTGYKYFLEEFYI